MSTQTVLETPERNKKASIYAFGNYSSANFAFAFERQPDTNTAAVRNLPVFRAGTFADSAGAVQTWEVDNLQEMVDNFAALQDVFPNVPVRLDHTRSVQSIVGYMDGLRVDGDLLLADFTFTEPEAADRWERGSYRSRSSEIGYFQTNEGDGHWPVFQGFAFVDIPAVEGLYAKSESTINFFTEAPMPTTSSTIPLVDPAASAVTPEAPETAEFTKPLVAAKFTVNGVETSDPVEVQAYIARMETFAKEQNEAARSSFAAKLVEDRKLIAPQLEAMTEFALSLDDAQFSKLENVFSSAAVLPVLEDHSAGTITNPNGESTISDLDQQIADAEEVVQMHTRAGLTEDQVKATSSYQKLAALRLEQTK